MNKTAHFKQLHQQSAPLLIANVWNAQSAKVYQKLNVNAIATSSSAVAATLGYADGEVMTFDEYLFVVKRIAVSVDTPLSVDLEGGYGSSAEEVVANIRKLSEVGVVGINIEDSAMENGQRKIIDAGLFGEKLSAITSLLKTNSVDVFVNVRCDAYLLGLPSQREEGIRRIKHYATQGVDGLFLPCITDIEDIEASVNATSLPLNVMCMPGLPDFEKLKSAGVKRISMGNFLNQFAYSALENVSSRIISSKNFEELFATK